MLSPEVLKSSRPVIYLRNWADGESPHERFPIHATPVLHAAIHTFRQFIIAPRLRKIREINPRFVKVFLQGQLVVHVMANYLLGRLLAELAILLGCKEPAMKVDSVEAIRILRETLVSVLGAASSSSYEVKEMLYMYFPG